MEPVKDTDPTIGKLVADASRDLSLLVKQEIELAKSELKISAKFGGMGVAMFAAAAFLACLFLVLLSITIALFINWDGHGLPLMWSFLIVVGAYALIIGGLVLAGIRSVKKVRAPERAIAQGKEIPQALKGKA
ncbi:phage holin family protein [Nocardioides bruguierae]|uniref:Phage holin family protein n=1 Tax=Nocardioides bruguierae TaxID=2945102 RepID=A0A9X2IFQ4_9ACTN|nr:phage holin family protein [Nocardioides bruguierae]MCL8027439.1 phage holin family protein [Nocardioides bruguierae]MCM0620709.1 phage holin family protein [Nocardioides bruguierae]